MGSNTNMDKPGEYSSWLFAISQNLMFLAILAISALMIWPHRFASIPFNLRCLKYQLALTFITWTLNAMQFTRIDAFSYFEKLKVLLFCKRISLHLKFARTMFRPKTAVPSVQQIKNNMHVLESLMDVFGGYENDVNSLFAVENARKLTDILNALKVVLDNANLREMALSVGQDADASS